MVKPMRRPVGGARRERGKGRYIPRRKVCTFCVSRVASIDCKNINQLRGFISERGRIEPRRKTGVCAKHQRALSAALKRARQLAMVPFTADHIRQSGWVTRQERPPFPRPPMDRFRQERPPAERPQVEKPAESPSQEIQPNPPEPALS